ncbi:uncharacterized protein LOC119088831 [Peromyscus leucopus]|uniref:uncharacterized protein LOC119088831 n=1 Tax=Peromyscus leucopus TaxID=10041 RepID=UPI00188586F7|nr:uncharacterized protein LOC119088831 [Peromyscus leucopus]
MRRAASRAHAALLPKLQSRERTGQKGVDPGNRRKERPLRVGCPDPRGTSLEWEAAPAALNRLKCCECPPVLPGLRPDTEWTPPPESEHPPPPRHPATASCIAGGIRPPPAPRRFLACPGKNFTCLKIRLESRRLQSHQFCGSVRSPAPPPKSQICHILVFHNLVEEEETPTHGLVGALHACRLQWQANSSLCGSLAEPCAAALVLAETTQVL